MNSLERQRQSLIAQLADLHEAGWEHQAEIDGERRLGIMDRPDRQDRRVQLERDSEISSLQRRLDRIEQYLACVPGCSCRGVMR